MGESEQSGSVYSFGGSDQTSGKDKHFPTLEPTKSACTQVTVNPDNSRVFVASTANDTLWVLDVIGDAGSDGCSVLELQVCLPSMNACASPGEWADSSEHHVSRTGV
ncbi:unnamed protein product [Ectocarpus fasciculatus]